MAHQAGKPAAAALVALAMAIALAVACSSGADKMAPGTSTPAPGETPAANETSATSPEDALGRYVSRVLSQGFVPDCDEAKRPDDIGKQCAKRLGKRGDLVAFRLGPTFSDPTRILILRPESSDWTLVSITTLDPSQPAAPGIPWPLEVNAQVVVAGTAPDCLKIREAPGIGAAELDCIPDGTAVTIVAGPADQDNIEWWRLKERGWAAGDYLRYPEEAPTPQLTPS